MMVPRVALSQECRDALYKALGRAGLHFLYGLGKNWIPLSAHLSDFASGTGGGSVTLGPLTDL